MTLPTSLTASRAFALVGLGVAIAGVIGTALVRHVSPTPFVTGMFGYNGATMAGFLISGLSWASIGALLVVRRPGNAIGWLMVVVGVGFAQSQLSIALTSTFAADGTPQGQRLAQIAGWATVMLQLVGIFQIAIGFLYPSGRVQSRRWGLFMRGFWVLSSLFVVTSLTQPGPLQLVPGLQNPFGFGPDLRGDRPFTPILYLFMVIVFVGLAVSMASRYRSGAHVERLQLKWFVLALGLSAIGLGIATSEVIFPDRAGDTIGLTVFVFAGALVPVAIGIAILRYRLYDIDRIISRTISYAAITAVLAAVFGIVALALGTTLGSMAEGDTIAVAGSTLLVAALFGPVRRQAQTIVDRRFDRSTYDATLIVQAMTARLRDDVDLSRVEADVLGVVDQTFHPTNASMWLR
jgi:vacuolar-type H+-ATPase subunit I/STV1